MAGTWMEWNDSGGLMAFEYERLVSMAVKRKGKLKTGVVPAPDPPLRFDEDEFIPTNTSVAVRLNEPKRPDEFEEPPPMGMEVPQPFEKRPWLRKFAWKPGQSPLSPGRPVKLPKLPSLLDAIGREAVPAYMREFIRRTRKIIVPAHQTNWEMMARALWRKASDGNMEAINFIAERIEGKVATVVDLTARRGDDTPPTDMTDEQLLAIANGTISMDGDADGNPFSGGSGTSEPEMFQE